MWIIIVIGKYIRRLTQVFTLGIQPSHPDRCGGLKRIGDLCLQMAAMFILFGLLISYWNLSGVIDEAVPELLTLSIISLCLVIGLAFFTFFVPMWDLHLYMVKEKQLFYDTATEKVASVEEQLRKLVSHQRWKTKPKIKDGLNDSNKTETDNETEIEFLQKQLAMLKKLYPLDLKFPDWPFDTSIFLSFLIPELVPILVLLIKLDEKETSFLENIFTLINKISVP